MKQFNIKLLLGYCIVVLLGYLSTSLKTGLFATPVFAEDPVTSPLSVTATVVKTGGPPSTPTLIAPANGGFLSNPIVTFIFQRSAAHNQSRVNHYDLYINNKPYVEGVSHDATPNETNVFYSIISNNILSLTVKKPFSDGTYTWKILGFNEFGEHTGSATWTFTIDTIPPFVIVTQVGENINLNLTSKDLASIPDNLTLITQSEKPIFRGLSEPGARISITVSDIADSASSFSFNTTVDSQGRFNLLPSQILTIGHKYKIIVVSADVSSNTTVLKDFYLLFERLKPPQPIWEKPEDIIKPPSVSLPPLQVFLQLPEVLIQIPQGSLIKTPLTTYLPYLALILLILWLVSSKLAYGFGWLMFLEFIKLSWLPFWWPRKKNGLVFNIEDKKGVSFAEIKVFYQDNPNEQNKSRLKLLTDLKGWFYLKLNKFRDEEKEKLMVSVKRHGFYAYQADFSQLMPNLNLNLKSSIIDHKSYILIPLSPNPKAYKTYLMFDTLCWLFLFLAFLSSLIAIILAPSLISLIVFILCLDLAVNMLIY